MPAPIDRLEISGGGGPVQNHAEEGRIVAGIFQCGTGISEFRYRPTPGACVICFTPEKIKSLICGNAIIFIDQKS